MKRLQTWRLLILFTALLGLGNPALWADLAPIVINEVCYDPLDMDSGFEWIELFNSSTEDIDLEGAMIQAGGSTFQHVFTIPHYILRAQRFVLIGEAQIPYAVFTTNLEFQNGGAETDGIRFVAPDGSYTDTVLYDSPNVNGLTDDHGLAGVSFAPDVSEGRSLARIMDGWDTNACAADFISEASSTPGLPNHVYVDYALVSPQTWQEQGEWRLSFWVRNLSAITTLDVADLRVQLDGTQIASDLVHTIAAGDSVSYSYQLPVNDDLNHLVEVSLDLYDDSDEASNHLSLPLLQEQLLPPVINEVMYDPDTGKQEWIEIWLPSVPLRGDYIIEDAAQHSFGFTIPDAGGYYVLCANSLQLLTEYTSCPAQSAIDVEGWAALNNDADTILLYDGEFNLLDQMSYVGAASQQGRSLERYLDADQHPAWRYSLDSQGATPGEANSAAAPPPDFSGTLKLTGSPCNPRNGASISLLYNLETPSSQVNCNVYDQAGRKVRVLADNQAISAQGSIVWDGKDNAGKYVPRGLYFILWESRASNGGKILRRQFSAALYD